MKYYVVSDVHGFYSRLHTALTDAGFFAETEPNQLVVLGDLFDRGSEAEKLQEFILELMEQDRVVLVRGNHEDLFVDLVTVDGGFPFSHHRHNGTFDTALQLTGYDKREALADPCGFAEAARNTPYYQRIIPAMLDCFESEQYVFVHGWIPCAFEDGEFCAYEDWRSSGPYAWERARWYNGMDAVCTVRDDKTVVCGHWHASYGHARFENRGSEFGEDADFSPYMAPGIIAVDGCTAYSGRVNVVVLEENEYKGA